MNKVLVVWCSLLLVTSALAQNPGKEPLNDQQFQERLRGLNGIRSESGRLNQARLLASDLGLSSRQVKEIAQLFANEQLRYDFALAAYPYTVDKENFYEVYDAFTRFSVVLRLHDSVRQPREIPGHPLALLPVPVSPEDFQDVQKAIKAEDFENSRKTVAKQILESKKFFTARQVREIVRMFDFEPSRLEIAKFAYDWTFDKDNYFVVNEAFEFANSRTQLAEYIRAKQK